MKTSNPVPESAQRAMKFLLPPNDTEAERAAAMASAERALMQATTALIRAGRDDLAFRASELAMDAR